MTAKKTAAKRPAAKKAAPKKTAAPGPEPMVVSTGEPRDTTNDRIPFYLQDDMNTVLTATRPKMAILVRLLAALGDDANPVRQSVQLEGMLDDVVDEDSARHLRSRFLDKDDDLDLDVLGPILEPFVGKWYGGPTGSRPGSRSSGRSTGPRSTVRRRS